VAVKSELTGAQSDALIDMLLDTPDMAIFLQRLVDLKEATQRMSSQLVEVPANRDMIARAEGNFPSV
jgi:hypothetical protein